jgi:hypothetical protein
MKSSRTLLLLPLLAPALLLHAQQSPRPWQEITVPTVAQAAANFKSPPHEYGAIQAFQGWNGTDADALHKRITADLDRMAANGMFIVNFAPGRRGPGEPAYLSPGHMDEVKFVVAEAAKRNMRLWIQDESDYPSGFADGYISQRYPQLTMQVMAADLHLHVAPGELLELPLPTTTLAVWATATDNAGKISQTIQIPLPADFQLKWRVPSVGSTPNEPHLNWQVSILRHIYLSSPTRADDRPDHGRAKDALFSIIDYLDPRATDAFLHITEETYYKAVGDQFGKTLLGFFGDEPDYSENNTTADIVPGSAGVPWTPALLDTFKAQKGYDLTPYLPAFFDGQPTEQSNRAWADYYDVWSGIFRDSFFGEQAAWAKAHNVEYLVHLNHEEAMLSLERSEGDYFRDERHVQVPGIDNLSQLIPSAVHRFDSNWSTNNNFPKLASSDAHLFGRPQIWAEEGGGTGVDGKYQMNFQLVRGVDALQVRAPGLRAPNPGAPDTPAPPDTPQTLWYANRASYLIAVGRPAAQVGLYHPGNSIWLGGDAATEADRSTTKLGWQLFEHQVDWDYFDEQSLSGVATISNGGFTNLSGQTYKTIVLPSMTVITRAGLDRLRAFALAGGKVIFVGKTPTLVIDKTYLDAKTESPDLSFATLEPSGDITPAVLAALPTPDVKVDAEFKRLTYTHRKYADGDLYFFFNESTEPETRTATLAGHGVAQDWDMLTGEIRAMPSTAAGPGAVSVPLVLGAYESKAIMVGPLPAGLAAHSAEPSFANPTTLADLNAGWALDLNGQHLTTAIKPWEELGVSNFAGPATYTLQFTAPAAPKGKRIYLEIGDVHDFAHVTLNGKEVGARSFQPYRWDITTLLKRGPNDLKIEVYGTPSQGRGGFGPPPTAAPTTTASATTPGLTPAPTAGAAPRRPPAAAGAAPAAAAGGGRGGPAAPATSGLLSPVKLVAY